MNATMQAVVAFSIVAFASGYAMLKFMPKAWRLRLAATAAAVATRIGLSASAARRVEAKLSTGGACGSCDTCKSCATPTKNEGAEAAFTASTPSRYKQIPIRRA
jgi:hypothetical protein